MLSFELSLLYVQILDFINISLIAMRDISNNWRNIVSLQTYKVKALKCIVVQHEA